MLFDITKFVNRDEEYNYHLIQKSDHFIINKLINYIGNENLVLIPSVTQILQESFPFINNKFVKPEIIDKSIEQGICVHNMVSLSIISRKTTKLNLKIGTCKNSSHINLAKRMITELNSFIYKYNIKKIYSEKTFAYINFDCNFIGTIDIILESEGKIFLMDIKTSKVNYVEKYNMQLFLYKKMIENSSNLQIIDCFILNPRENQVLMKYQEPSKKEQTRIISIINRLFKK